MMTRKAKFVTAFAVLAVVSGVIALHQTHQTVSACMATGATPSMVGVWSSVAPFLAACGFTVGGVLSAFAKFAEVLPAGQKKIIVGLIDVTRLATYKKQFDSTTNPAEQAAILASAEIAMEDLKTQLFTVPKG